MGNQSPIDGVYGVNQSVSSILNQQQEGIDHEIVNTVINHESGEKLSEVEALNELYTFGKLLGNVGKVSGNKVLVDNAEKLLGGATYIGNEALGFAIDTFSKEIEADLTNHEKIVYLYVPPEASSNLFITTKIVAHLPDYIISNKRVQVISDRDKVLKGSSIYIFDDFIISGAQLSSSLKALIKVMSDSGYDKDEIENAIKVRIIAGNSNYRENVGNAMITEELQEQLKLKSFKILFEVARNSLHERFPIVFGIHSDSDHGFRKLLEDSINELMDIWERSSMTQRFKIISAVPTSYLRKFLFQLTEPEANHIFPAFYKQKRIYKPESFQSPEGNRYFQELRTLAQDGIISTNLWNRISEQF